MNPDLGGFVFQNLLSPIPNSTFIGAVGELSLFSSLITDFTLPLATGPGQTCGIKLIDTTIGGNVDIHTLEDASDGSGGPQVLYAGILAQSLFSMTMVGNIGECAVFTSGVSPVFGGNVFAWFLTSYLPGSTFAP